MKNFHFHNDVMRKAMIKAGVARDGNGYFNAHTQEGFKKVKRNRKHK